MSLNFLSQISLQVQTIKINSQFVKTIVTMMENKNESKNGGDG